MFRSLGIIELDMHHRDTLVKAWILERVSIEGGSARITHDEIAHKFKCTRVTARNIVNRLISAGLISAEKPSNRVGYWYRKPNE